MGLSTTNVSWQTPLRIGRCLLPEEDKPWMMLPISIQRRCRTTDMHMQCLIMPSIVKHRFPKKDLPWLTLPNEGR